MSDEEKKDTPEGEEKKDEEKKDDESKSEKGEEKSEKKETQEEATSTLAGDDSPAAQAEVKAVQGMNAGLNLLKSIDANRAKLVFIVGLIMFFLLSFIQNGKDASIKATISQKDRLNLKYDGDRPVPPVRPLRPDADWYDKGSKSDVYTSDMKDYKEAKEAYDKEYKKFMKEEVPAYKKAMAEYEHQMKIEKARNLHDIQNKLDRMRAYRYSWAYFRHLLKYLSILIMCVGAGALAFRGNDIEKGVSLFFLAYVVTSLLRFSV